MIPEILTGYELDRQYPAPCKGCTLCKAREKGVHPMQEYFGIDSPESKKIQEYLHSGIDVPPIYKIAQPPKDAKQFDCWKFVRKKSKKEKSEAT